MPGLSFLKSNAAAPGTMDSYRRAVADFEAYASEIEQQLDWTSALVKGVCLEYLDLLVTQGFGPEVVNRLTAAIRMIFPRYSRHGDLDLPRTVKALKGWSRLTEWHPQQDADIRRFRDPQQAGPLMDGSVFVVFGYMATPGCPPDPRESERNRARGEGHFRRARRLQAGRGGVQPEARGTIVGLHENFAATPLAQPVKCPEVPKSVETSQCDAAGRASTGGVRAVEDNLERLVAVFVGGRSYP